MTRVDFHQHIWPAEVIGLLERRGTPPRIRGEVMDVPGRPSYPVPRADHELDARLALLDRDGLDAAVVSLPPTDFPGDAGTADAWHTGVARMAEASGGRLRPLSMGAVVPGFAGACVAADALFSDAIEPLLGDLEAAGQLLLVHPGPPAPAPGWAPGWWPQVLDYTAQMQTAYAAWLARWAPARGRLPVVFSILAGGAPFQLERYVARGADPARLVPPNVVFDTASYGPAALRMTVAAVGAGQVVYGSDVPVIDSGPALAAIAAMGDDVGRAAMESTPTRLLGD